MSEHAFYVEPEKWADSITLQGPELKHLAQVLRLQAGTQVKLMDGQGTIALASIQSVNKREAKLTVLSKTVQPQPTSQAIIALAFSKAVRRGFFLEKAVELGASEIWLWQGDHSQGHLPESVREAWQAKMIAGIKQCGNAWLPIVKAFPEGIAAVIKEAAPFAQHILPWECQQGVPMLTLEHIGLAGQSIYVIGPEGGFSAAELEALQQAQYSPVSFGRRILRCETAATLCLGLHWWASQQQGRPDAPTD